MFADPVPSEGAVNCKPHEQYTILVRLGRRAGVGDKISQRTVQQRATTQALAIAFSNQERIAHTQADERARLLLRNACDKNTFRNAVARLVSSQPLAHSIVESKEFKAMCLALNHQAGYVLIHSDTTTTRRIASNFEYQRSLTKAALYRASSAIT